MQDGHSYLIEMATGFRYIVQVDKCDGEVIYCSRCVWVATTGNRTHEFLAKGPSDMSEIEDMGPGAQHRMAALVSVFPWNHPIPATH